LFEKRDAGEFVIGRIHTNGFEHFGVFRQAELFETRLGEATSPDVAAFIVKLASPAWIFPGGSTEKDALRRQRRGGGFDLVAVESGLNRNRNLKRVY
jgi:hypothetical protein